MADTESIKDSLALADKTGLTDLFSDQNKKEIRRPFANLDEMEARLTAETVAHFEGKEKPSLPPPKLTRPYYEREISPQFKTDSFRKKGLFERMFGYNAEADMPLGYERMTEFQRAVYRANLNMQNIVSRMGMGVTMQTKGTLQLLLPKSIEEYLPTNTYLDPERLADDKNYEKRIQSELRKKKQKVGLSKEEELQLEILDAELPTTWQRGPEFAGRVNSEIVRIALAAEMASMIPVPGGGTLNEHLSELGRRTLGRRLLVAAETFKNRPVITTVLGELAKAMEQLGLQFLPAPLL